MMNAIMKYDSGLLSGYWKKFGNVRFDVKNEEQINYHDDLKSLNESVYSHLPDPKLGFSDPNQYSDVLNVFWNFQSTSNVPCGSVIFVLLNNYPGDDVITNKNIYYLESWLKQNHIFIHVLEGQTRRSTEEYFSIPRLCDHTNGFCGFLEYKNIAWNAQWNADILWWSYLTYAQNPIIPSDWKMRLADLQLPKSDSGNINVYYKIAVTNDGFADLFVHFNLTMIDTSGGPTLNIYFDKDEMMNDNANGTSWYGHKIMTSGATYSMSLIVQYAAFGSQHAFLEIRFYTRELVSYWIPFFEK